MEWSDLLYGVAGALLGWMVATFLYIALDHRSDRLWRRDQREQDGD